MRLPAAEAADVEGARAQRHFERWVVELGIVRERDDGGSTVGGEGRQRLVRPLRRAFHAGKPLVRRERTCAGRPPRRRSRPTHAIRASGCAMCTAPTMIRRSGGLNGWRKIVPPSSSTVDASSRAAASRAASNRARRDALGHCAMRVEESLLSPPGVSSSRPPGAWRDGRRAAARRAQPSRDQLHEHLHLPAAGEPHLPCHLARDAELEQASACRRPSRRSPRGSPRPRCSRRIPNPRTRPRR